MPALNIGDATIAYELAGDGDWLVLLHEIGGTRHSWEPVAASLTGRFKVLRYDMRGCGESSKISGVFAMETHVSDLQGLLDELGAPQAVHLGGVALGAALATRFAVRSPGRVRSLVLACPAPGVDADRVKYLEQRAAAVEREGMSATVESSLANSYPMEVRRDAAVFESYRSRFLANDPRSYAAINRAFPGFNVSADLTRIECPTLVLAGLHDRLRPPAFVREVANCVRQADYIEIDSGHIMPVQAPNAMSAAMTAFYAKIEMSRAAKSP